MPRDEAEAAYFTLLRAREELAQLQRYEDHLTEEARRLKRASAEASALTTALDPRLRWPFASSDEEFARVTAARQALIEDELARLPDRVLAARAFVEECERAHRALGGGPA